MQKLLTPQEMEANKKVADQMLNLSSTKLTQDKTDYNKRLVAFWKKRQEDLMVMY